MQQGLPIREMGYVLQGVQVLERGLGAGRSMGGASRLCHGNMHLKSDKLVAQASAERQVLGQAAMVTWNTGRGSRLAMASRAVRTNRLEAGTGSQG